mgnify:CR=1 FL=1
MNTYLAIITTVLVVTQIIRVTQNALQLKKVGATYESMLIQRAVFKLLLTELEIRKKERLEREENE